MAQQEGQQARQYERHPRCDSAFCQECRTGEGALLDLEHDIEEIIGRPLTLPERRIVAPYLETLVTAEQLARKILEGTPHPPQSNYGAW